MRIKRFLSLALCVCLLLGLLPSVGLHASAAEATICMNFVTENTRWSYGGVDFDCNRDSSRNITTADNGWAWYGAGNEVYAAKTLVLEPTFRLDTTNNVGILLNRSRFTQIRKNWSFVLTFFYFTAELGKRNYRAVQFTCQRF